MVWERLPSHRASPSLHLSWSCAALRSLAIGGINEELQALSNCRCQNDVVAIHCLAAHDEPGDLTLEGLMKSDHLLRGRR